MQIHQIPTSIFFIDVSCDSCIYHEFPTLKVELFIKDYENANGTIKIFVGKPN